MSWLAPMASKKGPGSDPETGFERRKTASLPFTRHLDFTDDTVSENFERNSDLSWKPSQWLRSCGRSEARSKFSKTTKDKRVSDDQHSVTFWLQQLKDGDEEAAHRLWNRYFNQLANVARQKLGQTPRRVADEEDVALSVFNSLCAGARIGRFPHLADRCDLWRLLLTVTQQKTIDLKRYQGREIRGGGEVRGDSGFDVTDEGVAGIEQVLGVDPTPSFIAMIEEQSRHLIDILNDDVLRKIALDRLDGYSIEEISERCGIHSRSVDRKLKLIRQMWDQELTR